MSLLEYLTEHRAPFRALLHPPAFSAQRRAARLRRPGRLVAKALLLCGPEGPFVSVLPATRRLDVAGLERLLGGPVRLASPDEVGATFRDCAWGVVSPFGSRYGLPTLLDDRFKPEARLVVEGQTPVEAFELRCVDLERITGALRAPLSVGDATTP
jgi:prolyl-tRNA editing enzyme YbaK/EbsC (Cys-tRNA(Pro) deacylase)